MDAKYFPIEIEEKWSKIWAERELNKPESEQNFSQIIPPPNVTGTLHMGHALNNTLQDILIRYNRMLGKNVLWQPGMDHAGIATEMVVERELATKNIKKTDFYRVLSKNSGSFEINLGIDKINKISDSYSDVEIADLFALFNYNENLEIGMNRGNAANLLGIKNHTQISIKFL